jgi:hypothetical protein
VGELMGCQRVAEGAAMNVELETARCELTGCWQRWRTAEHALAKFRIEHNLDRGVSPELRQSLDRELHALETELDAAKRAHAAAKAEFARVQRGRR